jgi:hypothetical protein
MKIAQHSRRIGIPANKIGRFTPAETPRYNTTMRRPRFQFRLSTIFAAIAVIACACLWFSVYLTNLSAPTDTEAVFDRRQKERWKRPLTPGESQSVHEYWAEEWKRMQAEEAAQQAAEKP